MIKSIIFNDKENVKDFQNNKYYATQMYQILEELKKGGYITSSTKASLPNDMLNPYTYYFTLNNNNAFTFNGNKINQLQFTIPNYVNENDRLEIEKNLDKFTIEEIKVKNVNKNKFLERLAIGLVTTAIIGSTAYMAVDAFEKESKNKEIENSNYHQMIDEARQQNGIEEVNYKTL